MSANAETFGRVEHANQADFARHVLQSEVPVLVDFYADWCGPCQMLAPVLDALAQETTQAKIVKVNVDQNPQLAVQYGVSSIPSLIVFQSGQVTSQHVGLASKGQLKDMLGL
ncbi:MAG: thioredoxin [Pirellulales bacterium]|nr:thioredoxin [Pirellulales bacterium]